ncbi:MAG TPA: hypothetical protein VKB03_09220 [Conexibacter sp.]|nr:hypothetical protein [Conexibacter sp.]
MRELQLIRSVDDKRRLDLHGIGSVRFENMWGTKLCLSAPGHVDWHVARRGRRGGTTAIDATGAAVATLDGRRVEHGHRAVDVTTPHQGILDRRPPFVLVEGDRELAKVAPHVWSEKPVDVTITDEDFAAEEPHLLLFALWAANRIAASRQAGAAAGGVT